MLIRIFVSILFLFFMFGCKVPKKVDTTSKINSITDQDSSIRNSQNELGEWLLTQPQEVRDAFKRDFVFKKEQIDSLRDTLIHQRNSFK